MDNEDIVREHQQILDLAKSNKKRIDTLEEGVKELRKLAEAVVSVATEQKNMREDLTEMKTDIKAIKEKPAKKWDMVSEKILLIVAGAVVSWILLQLGFPVGG